MFLHNVFLNLIFVRSYWTFKNDSPVLRTPGSQLQMFRLYLKGQGHEI